MKLRYLLLATVVVGSFTVWGCGSDDDDGASGSGGATGGTGGATGGTGGSAGEAGTGATGGTGGATGGTGGATGGTGGTAGEAGSAGSAGEAGSAGSAGEAGTGGGAAFWDGDYDSAGAPVPADGKHLPGMDCMTCHTAGSPKLAFGGTVYEADGTTPAPYVEVGVRDGSGFYSGYTATNGNFWVVDTGATIDWANAEVRFRNANGEVPKTNTAAAACNSCHTGALVMKQP